MDQETLAQEHMEKIAHQEDSSKENVVDTQQSMETIAQVDTRHLEDSNSEVQPFTISSKCNDVEMLDGSGIVEEKTCDNYTMMLASNGVRLVMGPSSIVVSFSEKIQGFQVFSILAHVGSFVTFSMFVKVLWMKQQLSKC